MPASCRRRVGVDLGEQGYIVAKVAQVLPRDPALGNEQTMQSQYAQAIASAEMQAYYAALKTRYKAEIKPRVAEAAASCSRPGEAAPDYNLTLRRWL